MKRWLWIIIGSLISFMLIYDCYESVMLSYRYICVDCGKPQWRKGMQVEGQEFICYESWLGKKGCWWDLPRRDEVLWEDRHEGMTYEERNDP